MKKSIALILCCGVGFLMSCQQQTTVDDVVNMMTEARGGAEALAALTDQVSTGEFTVHVGLPEGVEGPMTMPVTMTAKRPNKIRMDMYGPEGSIVYSRCYDGTRGWIMEMGQRKDMTEAQLQEIENTATTWFDGYLNYQDKGFTLELLADEVADEQNYMVLQVTDKHDNVRKHYINPETHFIERESGNMENSAGEWEPMVNIFQDYKMVDGIAWFHHMAQHNATGEMTWEMTVKEVKHNTGVDDAVFMAETHAIHHGTCNFTRHIYRAGSGPAGGTGDIVFVPVKGASMILKPKFGKTCVRITFSAQGFTNDFGAGGDRVLFVLPRIGGSTEGIYPAVFDTTIGYSLVETTGTKADSHTIVWTAPSSSGGLLQIFYRTLEPGHRSYILKFHLAVDQEL